MHCSSDSPDDEDGNKSEDLPDDIDIELGEGELESDKEESAKSEAESDKEVKSDTPESEEGVWFFLELSVWCSCLHCMSVFLFNIVS